VSFASPIYLAALALVPLALAAHVVARRRARRYAVRFPGVATLAPLLPQVSAWRRRVPLALFLAALAALGLALARPHATVAVPREQAEIVLVTDVSRSMLADDVDPSRLEAARAAAQRFLQEVPDAARVGAVAFSTDPHTLEPPTDDRAEIEELLDGLSADGGTATGDALAAALEMVNEDDEENGQDRRGNRGRPPAAILLLSDGETTTGRDPTEVARAAKRMNIPIHTVALGTRGATIETPTGAVIPVPPDPETMREIAEVSGGRAFQAEDSDDLSRIYEGLGSRVATKTEKREITVAFAAGGGLLLAAAAAFGLRATARLP
jgi:Ca-activated chloride channel family protein